MRPDMNGAFDEFDDMVEALEEQEDMVECKECFDLFPKTDCDKVELGYVCPTCRRVMSAPAEPEITSADITTGLYDQEFPDVSEYDPDSTKDWGSEPTVADALSDLIANEYEAIDGYEVADETVQHSELPEEEKEELLDTLDHIKEEEEEHIDELKDVCPECDKTDKDPEEESVDPEDPEEDTEVLTEAQLLEKPGAFAKAATKAKNFVKKVSNKMSGATANIDDLFYNGYTIIINDPTDTTDEERNSKKYHKSTQVDLNDAERAGAAASKMYPKATVTVRAVDIDITKLDPEVRKLVTYFDSVVAVYRKGSAIRSNVAKINARLKELDLAEDELFSTSVEAPKADPKPDPKPDPDPKPEEEDETLEGEEKSIEDYRKEALEILGEKAVAEDYTEESYAVYSPKYDDLARKIKSAKKIETFTDSYLPKLPGIVEKLNKLLVPAEDESLEDESDSSESDREIPTT